MAKNDPIAVLHDANRRNQGAVLELRSVHGWWGYGLNTALREMCREAAGDDFRLFRSRIGIYAGSLGVTKDELQKLVTDSIACGVLEADDERFWCPDVLRKMENYGARSKALSEAGRRGAQARLENREARLKPGLPDRDAGLQKGASQDSGNGGLLNRTELNLTQGSGEVPSSLEVPFDEEAPPPHPYAKFFNPNASDLSTGRRPMLEYPHLWMHPWELQDVRERWDAEGFTLEERRQAFRTLSVAMEQKQSWPGYKSGKAFEYLCGHVLTNALAQKKESLSVAVRKGDPVKKPEPRKATEPRAQKVSPSATIKPKEEPARPAMASIGEILKEVKP